MPVFSQSQDQVFSSIINEILDNTNITRASPGSKMRTFTETVAKKLGRMWQQFDINMVQAFLDGAEGKWLNYIGDLMGVERLGESPASLSSSDRNIKFYVDVGTFGDINGGNSILIPEGTLIGTETAGTGIQYKVVIDTILSASTSSAYIAVQSIRSGNLVNVGAKRLIYHNFSDYSDYINDTLKITNDAEIIRGQEVEGDINYRYRIAHQVLVSEKANATAIRLAALNVPGVADIVSIPFFRGIGTYDLLIKSITPTISQALIANVQEAIEKVTAHGIYPIARGPKEVGISLTGSIQLKNKISASEETELITSVTNNVSHYINNLDIGEDLVLAEIIEKVMSTSDVIKTIGTYGKPFDYIYSYTPSSLEDNKVRATLLSDLIPDNDQRVIVETTYAGEEPIYFRIVTA